MSGRGHIILIALAVVAAVSGCGRRARVIPPARMVDLYVDMFIADQWLRDTPEARGMADSTLFFDPIFRRHGYTFKDYEKSVEYYTFHTEKLSDITTKVSEELKARADYYAALAKEYDEINKENGRLKTYVPVDFENDSLKWRKDWIIWKVADADSVSVADSSSDSSPADAVGTPILLPDLRPVANPERMRRRVLDSLDKK